MRNIFARLSLRRTQKESLSILARVLESIELSKTSDLERDFPLICFAMATGVGKTRLMSAFISYLYLEGYSRHFVVLAPNLTIYAKL